MLFRYDQNFESGHMNDVTLKYKPEQSHHLLPLQYLDINIFLNERVAADHDSFKYAVNLKLPGNYTLILCFVEVIKWLRTDWAKINRKKALRYILRNHSSQGSSRHRQRGGRLVHPCLLPHRIRIQGQNYLLEEHLHHRHPRQQALLRRHLQRQGRKTLRTDTLFRNSRKHHRRSRERSPLEGLNRGHLHHSFRFRARPQVKGPSLRSALRGKTGDAHQRVLEVWSRVISPFQHILKVFEQQDKQIWETLAPGETSTFELFIESILHVNSDRDLVRTDSAWERALLDDWIRDFQQDPRVTLRG